MHEKECSVCKKMLSIDNFYTHHRTGYQSKCKGCHKIYRKKHYEDNKVKYLKKAVVYKKKEVEWYRQLKQSSGCIICGEKEACCLDFHHIRDKKFVISTSVGRFSRKEILEEIKKCIVVCANCHRKIHAGVISDSGSTLLCHSKSVDSIST